MDKKHTQTVLSYCAELSRYASLIEKELTKAGSAKNETGTQADRETNVSSTAFFTYSVILPDDREEETDVLIMGDFIVKNTGTETLNAPIICLRLSPAGAGSLSGKIRVNTKKRSSFFIEANHANEWHYAGENGAERKKADGEYWLAPNFCSKLAAGESLIFSGFTLSFTKPLVGNSVVVEGFAYFKEQSEGIASLNNIVINF